MNSDNRELVGDRVQDLVEPGVDRGGVDLVVDRVDPWPRALRAGGYEVGRVSRAAPLPAGTGQGRADPGRRRARAPRRACIAQHRRQRAVQHVRHHGEALRDPGSGAPVCVVIPSVVVEPGSQVGTTSLLTNASDYAAVEPTVAMNSRSSLRLRPSARDLENGRHPSVVGLEGDVDDWPIGLTELWTASVVVEARRRCVPLVMVTTSFRGPPGCRT
jgi:hypothetical protein